MPNVLTAGDNMLGGLASPGMRGKREGGME